MTAGSNDVRAGSKPRDLWYEWLLRVLGAYLDQQEALYCRILEMDQGFCIQYRKDDMPRDQCTEIFTSEDLRHLADRLKLRRGLDRPAPRRRLHGTLIQRMAGTYQDFFRALGWELDQIPATDVLIDDLRERVVVTFGRRGHGLGQLEEKRVAVVEPEERRAMLKDARDRRAPSPTLYLRTLASSIDPTL